MATIRDVPVGRGLLQQSCDQSLEAVRVEPAPPRVLDDSLLLRDRNGPDSDQHRVRSGDPQSLGLLTQCLRLAAVGHPNGRNGFRHRAGLSNGVLRAFATPPQPASDEQAEPAGQPTEEKDEHDRPDREVKPERRRPRRGGRDDAADVGDQPDQDEPENPVPVERSIEQSQHGVPALRPRLRGRVECSASPSSAMRS